MLVLKKTIYQKELEGGDAAFLSNLLEYYSLNIYKYTPYVLVTFWKVSNS